MHIFYNLKKKPSLFFVLLPLLAFQHSLASDSTYRKKPAYLSISVGYTGTKAFGSLPDMVAEFNNMYGITNARQKNGGAFAIAFTKQKAISDYIYYKIGAGYTQKQVNPEEGGYMLYKDSLKTGYLSIPLLFGIESPLNPQKTVCISIEAGPSANVALIDKTTHGQDRAGFKTRPVVLDAHVGGGFSFVTSPGVRFLLRYSYIRDLTHAYREDLYWGAPNERIRTRYYQLETHFISLGLQWSVGH